MMFNMGSHGLMVVLLVIATAAWGVECRRGIRTCRCQLQPDVVQHGKMVGRICYVVGLGKCDNFTIDAPTEPTTAAPPTETLPANTSQEGHQAGHQEGHRRLTSPTISRRPGQTPTPTAPTATSPSATSPTVTSPTPTGFVSSLADRAAFQRHQAALEESRRRMAAQKRLEQELIASGRGTVRPGSPGAVLAAEKRGDARSQVLGQKALEQIYFLQALLGRNKTF